MPSTALTTATPEAILEAIRDRQAEIASLDAQISHLKAALDTHLEEGTLQHLIAEDGRNFKYHGITLTRAKRKTWKYDDYTKKQLADIKLDAELNGGASLTTTYYWTVKCQP